MALELVIAVAVFILAVVLLTFASDKAVKHSFGIALAIMASSFLRWMFKVEREDMHQATRLIVEWFGQMVYF